MSGETLVTLAEARLIFREAERIFRAEYAAKVRGVRQAEAEAPTGVAEWVEQQIELREDYERSLAANGLIKAVHGGGAHVPLGTKAIVRGADTDRLAIAVK